MKIQKKINLLAYKLLVKKLSLKNMIDLDNLVNKKSTGNVYKDYKINRAYYKEKLERHFQKNLRKEEKENGSRIN